MSGDSYRSRFGSIGFIYYRQQKTAPKGAVLSIAENYQKLIKAPRLSIISVKKVLTSESVSSSTGLKSSIFAG